MNTKTFAQQARNLLMDGVAKKLLYWGFDTKGNVLEVPNAISGGYSFRGEVFDDPNVPKLWQALKKAVQHKGIETVVEEAAYTWFNRMMAIRIMAKNGYDQPQLENAEGLEHTPVLLQKARQGQMAFLNTAEQQRLKKIIGDYSKDQEAFALLLVSYCHNNPMLHTVFGKIDDYTELLLPDNMLQDAGFLHLLNTTDAITDAEYKEVELIGWLYQFYISEKKDEVFASFKKKKKAEAKDIPAATQIFTPNWIVKYMVQNTAGKIWLDKHPDSGLKTSMKYLVENSSPLKGEVPKTEGLINDITELTLIDPAAGSGHILVEGFDLLYQMYMEAYYAPEEAVESILKHNLFGLDIDNRAAQLATFAILLKAATKYRDVFAKGWLPNVYAMPEAQDFSLQELKDFLGKDGQDFAEELDTALRLMKQAKNLGSVMKLVLSEAARNHIQQRYTALCNDDYLDLNLKSILQGLKNYIPILLILTNKYAAVVANPPYMGQKNMNVGLKNYVNANYPLSKSDLFAVFMETCLDLNIKKGLMGMINQHSWMFLSSYEKLRTHILDNFGIVNMLHLGPRAFEELSGEMVQSTAFVFKKTLNINPATYYRLVDNNSIHSKEQAFLNKEQEFKEISQSNFSKIPSNPIAYWVSEQMIKIFDVGNRITDYVDTFQGIITGNNDKFLRNWTEVSKCKIPFYFSKMEDVELDKQYWVPYNKGGVFRKWYGVQDYVVYWKNGPEDKTRGKKGFQEFYLKEYVSWSYTVSNSIAARYYPNGFLWDVRGSGIMDNGQNLIYLQGLIGSVIGINLFRVNNSTLSCQVENIIQLPIIINEKEKKKVEKIVNQCNFLSKIDWDSNETSWDFNQSPLLNKASNLKTAYQVWEAEVTKAFFQLHSNEEALNRIFIDIYGLQEELSPDVPLKDITILQEELKSKDLEALEKTFRAKGKDAIALPINKAEVISQFISYAIGLFMGRYRLDKPGLNIAHPNPKAEELASYNSPFGGQGASFTIDEDAIIPLMGKTCNFPDDALQQFQQLLDTIWGHDTRTENVNFIQDCLDGSIEKFLVKDFYKYHCSMYKKKPIYWLFASPKGAFQVLVYMHRMNAFTVEKIRANYLLEHIKNLRSEETILLSNESNLSTQEAKRLDQLRKDITECEIYDLELKDVADNQIEFDLDDGVTVNYEKFKTVVAKIK
ncbi:BREX-1 system adenine-specific DNA-methyltransferase PglX [Mariniflexile ostreae]|uniref:site-specific DNA-methyltransferase (adenine-specific) n=1 Tax=Mariniflexile ostreae TaxID=1520892 RepID=A0ABV5FAR5_9FLAO